MPSKTEEYLALAQRTANGLTRYWESWTDYLTTASRLYKYSFPDQLMIYAQRPDATACADYDIWNNRMNRYVRRGSKGIALLDESSGYPRLHYVFDVSDTGVRRNSRDPERWEMNDDLFKPVSEMLAQEYGIHHERLSQQIADIAGKLAESYWDNNSTDILAIVDGSFLMDYDEAGQEFQFKSAAAISILYTVLERCGFEPAGWFDKDDFQAIYNFSTPDSVYALGAAVSDMSREVLRNIERTVKTTIRRRNNERSQHEYEQQSELHADRGLSSPEPDPEPAPEAAGQVRQAAPDVPEGPSPGAVQHDAPEREPVPAPDGTGADGREPDAADDDRTAEAGPGPGQGEEPDGLGEAHEQPADADRGNDSGGADLQLSFFDAHIPTEAQQIEKIDRAESEKTPSAFVLSQAEIENALRRGSNVEGSKLRIWKIYQLQPDRKLRAKALAKEYAPYGPGGSSHTYLDGSSGWLDHDSKGLTFEHYPDHQKVLLRWDRVEKYIDLMIQSDRYLSDKERRAIDFPLELNAASAAEYTALKAQHPDTLVGFEAGGNFMFYGEDAAKVAKVLNSALFTRETALGEVQVTGFPPSLWVRKSKELWSAGNDVYLAGLNEDGTHHQTKHLHKEDYLPIGSIINMDGRKFRIQCYPEFSEKPIALITKKDCDSMIRFIEDSDARVYKRAVLKPEAKEFKTVSCPKIAKECTIREETIERIFRGETVSLDSAQQVATALGKTVEQMFEVEIDRRPMTKKTMREYNLFIRSVLNYANDNYGTSLQMPMIKASGRKGKSVDCLHSDEVEALQAALQECSMLEKAIVLCLLNTGVRRGELAGLTWKDVNFREGTIHVSKSLLVFPNYGYQLTTTKESNIRDVDVAPEFMDFLKDYYAQWKAQKKLMGASWQKNLEKKGSKYAQSLLDLRGNDFVICNDYGFPINPDSYAALVRRVGKKAGIEKIHPHMFRHTFVSILLSNPNIGVATVAAEAGHAQPSTTLAIYTQVYDRRRDEIRKQMSRELYK